MKSNPQSVLAVSRFYLWTLRFKNKEDCEPFVALFEAYMSGETGVVVT